MWRFLKSLRKQAPRKVGLALSGGGVRGLAHIGVLKALEREQVTIDCLAGTSMGGLVAAWYAAGMSVELLEQEALRMSSLRRILSLADPALPRRGILEGQKVRQYLIGHFGDRTIEDLALPLALITVDLNSGCKVTLRKGLVADAVRATGALPGLFTPVEWGEQLLVDGGLLDNLPAGAARSLGADVVIAVDASSDEQVTSYLTQTLHRSRYVPNALVDTLEVLYRSMGIMMAEINHQRLAEARPEIIIRPAIPRGVTTLTGLSRAAETIAAGEEATVEALPRIRELLASHT